MFTNSAIWGLKCTGKRIRSSGPRTSHSSSATSNGCHACLTPRWVEELKWIQISAANFANAAAPQIKNIISKYLKAQRTRILISKQTVKLSVRSPTTDPEIRDAQPDHASLLTLSAAAFVRCFTGKYVIHTAAAGGIGQKREDAHVASATGHPKA